MLVKEEKMFIHIKDRFKCPCCGYPTLPDRRHYDICNLCDWEDDGQDDYNAYEIVSGGPNGEYTLREARENFKKYYVMYPPEDCGSDQIGDEDEDINIKIELMRLYTEAQVEENEESLLEIESKIGILEEKQHTNLEDKIKEYEKNIKSNK